MLGRFWNDPFIAPNPSMYMNGRQSILDFVYGDEDMKQLQAELDKANLGNDDTGHTYSRSTFTTRTPEGMRTHDVKTYKAADGREIVKEIRRLGDQTHQVTKIKGADAKEPAISANLEGKALEDFNTKWDAYEKSSGKLQLENGNAKEIDDLRNQMEQMQKRIKQLENQ